MFKPRTEPVPFGLVPYKWGIESVYQCTWYCYYRALEVGFSAPTYWDRATKTGSYTNAKEWLKEFRDPWIPITDPNYKPVQGDILVYDGEFGHAIFMETDTMTSEYRNGLENSFRNAKLGDYKGVLLGVLHYPYSPVTCVERNENVPQIKTTDESLRIRLEPSLSGEIVGHVQLGYYNVLDLKEADGYIWYEISNDRWCANITVEYLPKVESDMVEQIRKWADMMIADANDKQKKIESAEADFKQINEISKRWIS